MRDIEGQLSKVDRVITRLLDAYQEEMMDLDTLRARMRQLRSRRAELEHAARRVEMEQSTAQDCLKLADDVAAVTHLSLAGVSRRIISGYRSCVNLDRPAHVSSPVPVPVSWV